MDRVQTEKGGGLQKWFANWWPQLVQPCARSNWTNMMKTWRQIACQNCDLCCRRCSAITRERQLICQICIGRMYVDDTCDWCVPVLARPSIKLAVKTRFEAHHHQSHQPSSKNSNAERESHVWHWVPLYNYNAKNEINNNHNNNTSEPSDQLARFHHTSPYCVNTSTPCWVAKNTSFRWNPNRCRFNQTRLMKVRSRIGLKIDKKKNKRGEREKKIAIWYHHNDSKLWQKGFGQ